MQIKTDVVKKHIKNSSQVVIMAHRNLDFDALGSSLGLYYICQSLGKKAFILVEDESFNDGIMLSLNEIKKRKISINTCTYSDIKELLDEETLLIIIDTSNQLLVQSQETIDNIKNKILIDHHIFDDKEIKGYVYSYIGVEQSSSVEIVIEMLKKLDIYIHPYVSTIMLAGIFIDTNRFLSKASDRTHEAAAYLYKCGALSNELEYLLKEDEVRYNDRYKVISEAQKIGNKIIIAIGHKNIFYRKEDLAKIADNMLLFKNIEASFSICRIDDSIIGISARSLGNINVQKIMEKLGGGGHFNDAATQIKGSTLDDVFDKLKGILKKQEVDFK